MQVRKTVRDDLLVVEIDRPAVRNAVDRPTADALEEAFRAFDRDPGLRVAVLTGGGGTFCAGADLAALAHQPERANRVEPGVHAPMGPTRLTLTKPVIAAIEGHAVAGGLELALWCDLRVAARDAVLGVFSRRFGVPLIDGGTVRLPRLVGLSMALDMILTGRPVSAEEAFARSLVNRLTDPGGALQAALDLAATIAAFPQATLGADRAGALETFDLPTEDALAREHERGVAALQTGEAVAGAERFAAGVGRHGAFEEPSSSSS